MSGSIWARLGIARTDDLATIRRAYAERLKAIEEDTDREGFIALRGAFETARSQAGRKLAAVEPVVDPPEDPAPSEAGPAASEPVAASPAPAWHRPTLEEDAQALQALLFGEASRETIFEPVRQITRRMLASPELENVDRRTGVETWMANTIVRAIPRSNGMLDLAIIHFRWAEAAQQWNCPPVIRAVMDRYRDAQAFDERIRSSGSAYHDYYRMLMAPPPRRMLGRTIFGAGRFLQMIDQEYPSLRSEFAPADLTAWRERIQRYRDGPVGRTGQFVGRRLAWFRGIGRGQPIWRWLWFAFIIFQFVRLCSSVGQSG